MIENISISCGSVTLNAGSENFGVINADVILNGNAVNSGTINGNLTLTGTASNNGTVSGSVTDNTDEATYQAWLATNSGVSQYTGAGSHNGQWVYNSTEYASLEEAKLAFNKVDASFQSWLLENNLFIDNRNSAVNQNADGFYYFAGNPTPFSMWYSADQAYNTLIVELASNSGIIFRFNMYYFAPSGLAYSTEAEAQASASIVVNTTTRTETRTTMNHTGNFDENGDEILQEVSQDRIYTTYYYKNGTSNEVITFDGWN